LKAEEGKDWFDIDFGLKSAISLIVQDFDVKGSQTQKGEV